MPKPIVVTNPWGESEGPDAPQDHHAHDRFYVHGYSDKRQDFEQEKRAGGKPTPLPWRFQYVTVERSSGQPTNEKVADFKGRGYVAVPFDEAASYGIDVNQSAFVRGPDGTCRQGSQMLMVAPKEAAARDYRLQMEKNAAMSTAMKQQAAQAAEDYNARHPGFEPTAFEFDEKTGADAPSAFEFEKHLKG